MPGWQKSTLTCRWMRVSKNCIKFYFKFLMHSRIMKISYLQVVSCRLYDVFSVSRAVSSVYVCQCEWTMIIQLDDLWPRYLAFPFILTMSCSRSEVKVIAQNLVTRWNCYLVVCGCSLRGSVFCECLLWCDTFLLFCCIGTTLAESVLVFLGCGVRTLA